jgi:hypothetical protein
MKNVTFIIAPTQLQKSKGDSLAWTSILFFSSHYIQSWLKLQVYITHLFTSANLHCLLSSHSSAHPSSFSQFAVLPVVLVNPSLCSWSNLLKSLIWACSISSTLLVLLLTWGKPRFQLYLCYFCLLVPDLPSCFVMSFSFLALLLLKT